MLIGKLVASQWRAGSMTSEYTSLLQCLDFSENHHHYLIKKFEVSEWQ